ncbi:MAG: hypothetical protein IJZ96_05895 [Lachnospiraceae bacterium]|nr:hypothetical protein [Lachnospiraceae bacterium]MBQ8166548.1 hypothetical protein [Lachnospiraceae bacterium]
MDFDWKDPDQKELDYILEFANKEYKNKNSSAYLIGALILVLFEIFPLCMLIGSIASKAPVGDIIRNTAGVAILGGLYVTVCYSIKKSRQNLISDINNKNIKIMYVVVRDKKTVQNGDFETKYATVQMSDSELKELKISDELYSKIGLGSLLIAVKYENGTGFNDEYDLLLNPNTIAEND